MEKARENLCIRILDFLLACSYFIKLMCSTYKSRINLEFHLWGMNFPNYLIPDSSDCTPHRLRLWFLFRPVLQNSTLCTGSCYCAAGEHPAICYLTSYPSEVCLQLPPPIFHLMPAKCLDYSPGYCHCSAARVGREEKADCPAHCSEAKGALGHTSNEQFGWWVFSQLCCSTVWDHGYGMGESFP